MGKNAAIRGQTSLCGMIRRFLLVCVLWMIGCSCMGFSYAETAYEQLINAISAAPVNKETTIRVTGRIDVPATISISDNKQIMLICGEDDTEFILSKK